MKIKWPQKGYADHSTEFCEREGGQNSIEWSAYSFRGHFILILQLNIVIKLTAELRVGGYPFSDPQNYLEKKLLT